MAKIRQEINILDHLVAITSASATDQSERVLLDTTQYNGTVSYYIEFVAKSSSAGTNYLLRLLHNADGHDITQADFAITTSYALYRKQFTPDAGAFEAYVSIGSNGSATLSVKSARIVIIQEATTLTNTETQIEIGNYNTARTAETITGLTNPKYWKYDASKWDGTCTFYAEAVYDSGSMDTITVRLQKIQDGSTIEVPIWDDVVNIVSAAETTTPTITRVAFTPIDGKWYRIASFNGSMDNHDIYRAGIVVHSTDGVNATKGTSINGSIQGGTGGAESSQARAQAFKIRVTSTISAVDLILAKSGSPTDNLNVDIVSSLGGSSLANGTIACSSLTTSLVQYTITFGTPVALTGGSTYYIQLTRSGARDVTNYPATSSGSQTYSDGSLWNLTNNVWTESAAADFFFLLTGQAGFTKLEPQYLLANTLFAAGTALQTFLTDWDSTEWDDGAGSITYYFQAEAANGSTSDVTLEQADGGGTVTNSTLTNIDNAQISSALTMPGDENLDVKATTNAGDVAAARILVAYVFSAAASAALTGTVTASITEADIVTGGKTIILTLTGDTFIAAGTGPIGSTANTQALINGIDSAQSETNGWNNVVQPGIETTDVVRTSNTVATITLDAEASYNITATETITATIPAEVLTGAAQIVATPTFTISPTSSYTLRTLSLTGVGR